MSDRRKDALFFMVLVVAVVLAVVAMPKAMEAETEYQQAIALKRCVVNGDFDDSTEYCRAVAKQAGQ
jgi:CDP-diacylglycerol pyrophosphatase